MKRRSQQDETVGGIGTVQTGADATAPFGYQILTSCCRASASIRGSSSFTSSAMVANKIVSSIPK
jgi:hypothetical protein